ACRRPSLPRRSAARHGEAGPRRQRAEDVQRRPGRRRLGSRARLPDHRRRRRASARMPRARRALRRLPSRQGDHPRGRQLPDLLMSRPHLPSTDVAPGPPAQAVPAGYPGYIEADFFDVRGRHVRDYLWILYKYRWLAATCFGVVLALTCLYTLLTPPVYNAHR